MAAWEPDIACVHTGEFWEFVCNPLDTVIIFLLMEQLF